MAGRAEPAQNRVASPPPAFLEFREEDIAQPVPARFEQQAARSPDRTAVKATDRAITYGALNQAANRIARAIVAARGTAVEPVALLVDDSVAAVAGILGVLKAGKVVVPLDASHPAARIAYILRHSQAAAVVADTKNLALVESLGDGPLPAVDIVTGDIGTIDAGLSTDNPGLSLSPDAVDWIVYTSGSTGEPKGVFRTHRASMHTVRTFTNSACVCPTNRLLLLFGPGLAAAAVLAFVSSWNEFLFAFIFTARAAKTVPVALAMFVGETGISWGAMTAGATLVMAPSMVLAWLVQRHLVHGVTSGALK